MATTHEPIRILHIVGRMDRGGIETMLMNIYRKIDRDQVQFDFLAHYGKEAAYNEEIRALGGRIYEMPALKDENHVYYWRLFSYIRALNRFFREHREYKVIHGHMTNTASIYMPIARKYGVRCTIAHSHNTKGKAGLLGIATDFLQKPIHRYATDWFACSQAAAGWFYPEEAVRQGRVTVVPNAVNMEKFRFSAEVRDRVRRELGLEGHTVIGCVGRFRPEKNQKFLLPVLRCLQEKDPGVMLLFVGDGPCETDVKEQCRAMGLSQSVLFLGQRADVDQLMQAMDVFVLPSFWEGLPLVGVEAQCAGLPCVVSDGVTEELNLTGNMVRIALDDGPRAWAAALEQATALERRDTCDAIRRAGYDLDTTVPWLQDFYLRKADVHEQQD